MMECTTGLTDDEFDGLLAWLREEGVEGYPPILGLSGSLRATLMYLRQNIVQAVIGEILGVSQPTVSRAIKALTEAISRTLAVLLLTAEEVPEDCGCRGGRHPHPLPGLARPPRSVVGQAQARGDDVQILVRPDGRFVWAPGAPIRGPCTMWPHWTPPDCWREWTPPGGSATRAMWEEG